MHNSALIGLPEVVFAVLPELRGCRYDEELRADCSHCVLLPEHSGADPTKNWAFNPATRCCTYKPRLSNYLIGRALWRGGRGAQLLMTRLSNPPGVTRYGIEPTEEEDEAYQADMLGIFGHDERMVCPFYMGGENSCGIWPDRPGVCRTWFCRHERGEVGRSHWMMLHRALWGVEQGLAHFCADIGSPPEPEATSEEWARFYRWCAGRVDRMTTKEVALFRDDAEFQEARDHLSRYENGPDPIPDRVCASLRGYEEDNGLIFLCSYTWYDGIRVPRTVFAFLSRLDGTRTWREALEEWNAELDEPLPEKLVHELYRIGALRDPEPGDFRGEESTGVVIQLDPDKSWSEQIPNFLTR
ncbi:MAG: hypothetical protein JRJ84_22295 [Deltaproteobacteria bacterium]|nr:hypothetical protein [Deltaproteobacteria bacterium]